MTELVIETTGLRKEYRASRGRPVLAVDGLDLAVPRGGVHGLLGPNGSGKTTTIRMLLGLAAPSAGTARVLGEPVPRRLAVIVDRVGAVVDRPRFSPRSSGRRNLLWLARSRGLPTTRVDEVIDRVGLSGRDRDRCRTYSPGMLQRLALGAALLKSPELLILDEPTDGLEPSGVREIRELIRELASSGATVLLSSHLLAEVQQVCDSVSILSAGRQLSAGPVEALVGREASATVQVGVRDPDRAAGHLAQAGFPVSRQGGHLYVDGAPDPAEITRILARHDLYVHELAVRGADLESVVRQLADDRRSADLGGDAR